MVLIQEPTSRTAGNPLVFHSAHFQVSTWTRNTCLELPLMQRGGHLLVTLYDAVFSTALAKGTLSETAKLSPSSGPLCLSYLDMRALNGDFDLEVLYQICFEALEGAFKRKPGISI